MGLLDTAARSRRVVPVLGATIVTMLLGDIAVVAAQAVFVDTRVTWTMVDVTDPTHQGDAHLITTGDRTVLIDAGPYDLAGPRLVRHLRDTGVDRLDLVFISHAHTDHYGGVKALLEAGIEIGQVEISLPDAEVCRREVPWGCSEGDIQQLLSVLREAQVPVEEPRAPRMWDLGNDVSIELIQRLDSFDVPVDTIDVNDTSMVLRLDVANTSVLFGGDLNRVSGEHLLGRNLGLREQVILKVPHHGTEMLPSDAFFAAVDPDVALVPSPAALWRSDRSSRTRTWLETHRVPAFVSGEVGHVTVHLGEDLRIDTEHSATRD